MSTFIYSLAAAAGTTGLVLFVIMAVKAIIEGAATVTTSAVVMADTTEMIAGLKTKNKRPLINGIVSTTIATVCGVLTEWWVAFIAAGVLAPALAFLLFQLAERKLATH